MALLILSADWSYLSNILRTCVRSWKSTLRTLPVAAVVKNASDTVVEKPEDHEVCEYKRYVADSVVRFMSGDQRTSVAYWLYYCAAGAWIAVNLNGMIMADETTLKMSDFLPYRWFPRSGNWKEDLDKFRELHPEEKKLDPSTFRLRRFHIYLHRISYRLLTVGFLAPCVVYWLQGYLSLALRNQMFLGGCLLASQFPLDLICRWIGSGKERIRLGQYRTTIQVMAPVLAYGLFLYNGLTMLPEPVDSSYIEDISQLRILGKWLIGLHLGGIFVGTFATELDAAEPTEKHKTIVAVQEYLGYFTFLMINSTFIFGATHNLHPQAVKALKYIMITGYGQLGLGVLSTYLRAPSLLTWINQNCSMGLYSFMIWFVHELRPLP